MRTIACIICVALFCLVSKNAYCEENFVALEMGAPAPYSGILIPESEFWRFMNFELELKQLRLELQLEKKYAMEVENKYFEQLNKTVEPVKWYETNSFNSKLGFGMGVLTTTLVLFFGVKVLQLSHG